MSTTKTASELSVVTTEHPNAISLREGFAAFGRGDLDHVRARLTDDCTWTNPGTSAIAGTYEGWDQIAAMFGRLFEISGGTFSMDVISCLADDVHAVAIYDATSTVAGETRTMRFAFVEELAADGRAKAVTALAYDQAAADAHMAGIPQPR